MLEMIQQKLLQIDIELLPSTAFVWSSTMDYPFFHTLHSYPRQVLMGRGECVFAGFGPLLAKILNVSCWNHNRWKSYVDFNGLSFTWLHFKLSSTKLT